MSSVAKQFKDVVVIGSGVGGLVAALRLAQRGLRPLVLERQDQLGGRFSTENFQGYKMPTGAVAVEIPGPWSAVFDELGLDTGLVNPGPVQVRIKGRLITGGGAMWEMLIKSVTKSAASLASAMQGDGKDLEKQITVNEWAHRFTDNDTVHHVLRMLTAGMFGVNTNEVSAKTFLTLLRKTGGYKRYAIASKGNLHIVKQIGQKIEALGGEIRLGWQVAAIEIENGVAVAVHATDPAGVAHRIPADAVVSNAGPRNTARFVADSPVGALFSDRVKDIQTVSQTMLAFTSSKELLPGVNGVVYYTNTERLYCIVNMSKPCPDLSPSGQYLYLAHGSPRPSLGGTWDADFERSLLEADLRNEVPGYDKATFLKFKTYRGDDAPIQQAGPGLDASVQTPVPNLVEVGDGVKPEGTTSTSACPLTADLAMAALFGETPSNG